MRDIFWTVVAVFATIILIPILLIQSCDIQKEPTKKIVESNKTVRVYINKTREIEKIDLEEYIKGVVSSEMPAAFNIEALKAQAIAARSYATARKDTYKEDGHPGHPGAELCDGVHCQAYKSKEDLKELKGKKWMEDYWPKIEKAVEETKGLVITYSGEPINQPLFHSTSGGKTENSEDVFSASVPYLRSVESPYEAKAPHCEDQQIVSIKTFVSKIKNRYKDCDIVEGNIKSDLKILERSTGGRILKIQVGNKILRGRDIRDIVGLRSANFKVRMGGGDLIFDTIGYGHGVGMSQWGANGMAERGSTFEEILKHYYVGVEIEKMK
ncbi:stage II sporulation protein D [Lutibacter sp. B2]|nr:stage II sporulation protein D [Lutibacter sp. B2]